MLILSVISCKTVDHKVSKAATADVLLTYSKSACLGQCPVYDLKILEDGMLVYEGKDKVKQKGTVMTMLSAAELAELVTLLDKTEVEPAVFKRVRDRPITVLEYNEKKYKFHSSQLDGQLKRINSTIENLVAQVNVK